MIYEIQCLQNNGAAPCCILVILRTENFANHTVQMLGHQKFEAILPYIKTAPL